jgi:uncharacterized protein YaaW (UPF0174 family)
MTRRQCSLNVLSLEQWNTTTKQVLSVVFFLLAGVGVTHCIPLLNGDIHWLWFFVWYVPIHGVASAIDWLGKEEA